MVGFLKQHIECVCVCVCGGDIYHNLEEVDMAEVILLKEGRQPPGKMYSFMKSELNLYSSYLSSGMDINCTQRNKKKTVKLHSLTVTS